MEVTNDRRYLEAKKLRYLANKRADEPLTAMKAALGLDRSKTYRDVLCALADLIEPTTCANLARDEGFQCSRCGDTVPAGERKDWHSFCPCCGAEVVEDE